MRLLHTSTLKFYEFFGDVIPKYAILSHTWEEEEISFQELQKGESEDQDELRGYRKIKDCCKLAASDGWPYVWIDTCCIDKTSSAELSEAINSMYRWYEEARVCYAYLVDVDSAGQTESSLMRTIEGSRWFTRGWTLQELLAPNFVVFYDQSWVELGTRSSLSDQISKTTGIKYDHMIRPLRASVAAKMSWASRRRTTRIEDIAYSLMGLFEVNMPLLYGEGRNAFTRLQHEIVKISDDESIFAWEDRYAVESGAFARSPTAFHRSGDLVSVKFPHLERPPYTVTHRGLAIELPLVPKKRFGTDGAGLFRTALQCADATDLARPVLIELTSMNKHDWIRTSPDKLIFSNGSHKDHKITHKKLVYIKPTDKFDSIIGLNQAPKFYVKTSSLRAHGFLISETYQCQPQLSFWDKAQHEECWMIKIDLQDNLAALLLKNDQSDQQEAFAIMLMASKSTPQMVIFIPTGPETLTEIVKEIVESQVSQNDQYKDRVWTSLQHKSTVLASLRRRDAGCLIDINITERGRSVEYYLRHMCQDAGPEFSDITWDGNFKLRIRKICDVALSAMEDKGKGFSLRQKKSRQVGQKQISGPIQTNSHAKGSTRPNINGTVETSTANTSDLVKRRYSTRFTNLPDFSNADVPPVPSVPTIPTQFAQSDSRPSTARQNQQLQPDVNALKDPDLQIENYSKSLLSDASDQELQNYQASLRKLKNRTSTDLQQNVYQNRTQFIKISKEAEKLKGEMRTLRGLMSELTTSLNQASMNAGAPEPRAAADDGARSRARKQANRSSVANLEAMWNTQLHALWKNVEGSQKFLPAIPGRHVVLEQSTWLELDAATWKAKRYAHIFLLNDHLMVATKRKRRVDPNAMTNGDAGQKSSSRTVADKCWPLQDIDMVDLASAGSSGMSERGGMSNAISVRYGHESFTYRSDKSSATEKTNLLQAFRRTADELRKALQADMEENVNKSKETMNYLTARDPALSDKTDLLRSLSGAKDRPEILIDVDGKHQNLRWVEGQIDELDSEVALQKFEDAVRHVEKLRRLAKGLKGNILAQDLISTKVDERARTLADILALRLAASHAQMTATQANIAYLVRLDFTLLARTTYLAARTTLIHTRARSIMFEGDLPLHVNQISYVYFTLIRNTVKTYQQCFPPVMMSSCVQWAKERLDEFNALLGRQLGSVSPGCAEWNDCMGKAVGNAAMVGEVGLDFVNLVGLGIVKEKKNGGELAEKQKEGEQQQQQ